jgi:hypothetical protein
VWLLAGAAAIAAWVLFSRWLPPDDPAFTTCLFRRFTHHGCATCGMTRAVALLVRGDLRGSLARHPLAAPFAAEAALLWLLTPLAIRRRWRPPPGWTLRWVLAHVALLLVVWVWRMTSPAVTG